MLLIVFLTHPTIEELQVLDMPILVDMLSYQTNLYLQLMKSAGVENSIQICRDTMKNIQVAIEFKRNSLRNSSATGLDISFSQDVTPTDPIA
jgi:hypothetical protein